MAAIKILIVDDHPVVREGLKTLLGTQSDMVVTGEAGSSESALAQVQEKTPDVILLDLHLPDVEGSELIAKILALRPGSRIIVLSSFGSETDIRSSMDAGAKGYLLKDAPWKEIFAAIRNVSMGLLFISQYAASKLADNPVQADLTKRELEVLEMMVKGLSNREIGQTLDLAEGTVKVYVHNILGKLDAKNRSAAVHTALSRGLVRQPS